LHKRQGEPGHGRTASNPGHLGIFRACLGEEKERPWGWEVHSTEQGGLTFAAADYVMRRRGQP